MAALVSDVHLGHVRGRGFTQPEVLGTRERLWGVLIGRRKHAGLNTPGQAVNTVYRWMLSWRRGILHRSSPDYESYEDYFHGIARGE